MKHIAVLGAGGTGHAIAADLSLAGFEVNLYEHPDFHKGNLEVIGEHGGITITGAERKRFTRIKCVTSKIEEALHDVGIIIVAVMATRHEGIAELCAPYLADGQTIVISAGNAGSLVFANKLNEKGVSSKVAIAEFQGNLYSCRMIAPAEVFVALSSPIKYIAAFPAKDTGKVIDDLKGLFNVLPATNVVEAALNSPNLLNHLAASLLNTGAIEQSKGEFYLFRQGLTPSVIRCIQAMHAEKSSLFGKLGYIDRFPVGMVSKIADPQASPELEAFRGLIGPTNMQHRYISEDASTSVSLMVSLGDMINVPTPLAKALITIASIINQVDYLKEGRNVEKLGISGLTANELNGFLAEGRR
jgi:opine dehydrogenase